MTHWNGISCATANTKNKTLLVFVLYRTRTHAAMDEINIISTVETHVITNELIRDFRKSICSNAFT